jgi:hypothetical protein
MEATDIIKILTNEGIDLANNIRANIGAAGQWTTGETGNSLHIKVTQEGTKVKAQLLGRPYFMTVQTGRKPTPGKKPSREMISNITRWVEARGIDLEAVWAIAMTIQRRGTDLWLRGGRTDIVDPAVDEFINNVSQALADAGADDLVLKIRQAKW